MKLDGHLDDGTADVDVASHLGRMKSDLSEIETLRKLLMILETCTEG